ncbi:DUF222 domain-containing protein, partial [Vallicoccus soli]
MAAGVEQVVGSPVAAALGEVAAVLGSVSLVTSDPRSVTACDGLPGGAGGAGAGGAVWQVPTGELSQVAAAVLGLRARLDAVLLAVVREADVRGLHAAVGAGSTARWLAGVARWEPAEARGFVADAAALAPGFGAAPLQVDAPGVESDERVEGESESELAEGVLPPEGAVVGAQLALGRVDRSRAQAVLRAVRALPHDASPVERVRAEVLLADCARDLTVRQVGRAGRRLAEALAGRRPDRDDPGDDPAGALPSEGPLDEGERVAARRAEELAAELYEQRRVWWRRRGDGSVEGGFRLDPVSAAPVVVLLEAAARRPDTAADGTSGADADGVGDGGDAGDAGDADVPGGGCATSSSGRARESGQAGQGGPPDPQQERRPPDHHVDDDDDGDESEQRDSGGRDSRDGDGDDGEAVDGGSGVLDRRTRAQRAADVLVQLCTWAL